jgi:hypothetical protein
MAFALLVAAFISSSALRAQPVGDPRMGSWDEREAAGTYATTAVVKFVDGHTRQSRRQFDRPGL